MPFTMPNFPILTPEQSSPFAQAMTTALSNYQNIQKAKYAPRLMEAEIFNKQFAPLAQYASSPLAMAMLPQQQAAFREAINRALQGINGSQNGQAAAMGDQGGGQSVGQPVDQSGAQGGQGGQGGSSQDAYSGQQASDAEIKDAVIRAQNGAAANPNLPSPNLMQGAPQKATAQYSEQLHPQGSSYVTPNNQQMTASTGGSVEQSQKTMAAAQNFKDLLPGFVNDASEFTDPKGSYFQLLKSGASAVAERMGADKVSKLISDDPEKMGRYTTFQTEKTRMGNILKAVYPTSDSLEALNKHLDMLEIRPTDTAKSYKERMVKLGNDIDLAIKNAKMSGGSQGGFNANPNSTKVYGEQSASDNNTSAPSWRANLPAPPAGKIWAVNRKTGERGLIKKERQYDYEANGYATAN